MYLKINLHGWILMVNWKTIIIDEILVILIFNQYLTYNNCHANIKRFKTKSHSKLI